MSNIAGKAFAMNLVTPIGRVMAYANKVIFWAAGTCLFRSKLKGLETLSMIHYARWVILRAKDFPRLDPKQPREQLRYSYMLFFSNFNGSWAQYIDSFSAAIPAGLDLLWWRNVGWPKSVPQQPFHRYVMHNQLFTNHYYSAYPLAASNDVKAAQRVRDELLGFVQRTQGATPDDFKAKYDRMLWTLQHDIGLLEETPVVSLATAAADERQNKQKRLREGAVRRN